jgi:CHAD domain-containing protein
VFKEENLHEFRKRIKKIRYVAEIHGADPKCARIAAQVKKAQDAIGEWHDWHVLARTAAKGKHVKEVEAVELLNSLTAETYAAAVATCDGALRRMADLERDRDAASDSLQARPVRNEVPPRWSMKKFA